MVFLEGKITTSTHTFQNFSPAALTRKRAAGAKFLRFRGHYELISKAILHQKSPKICPKTPKTLENPPMLTADLEKEGGFSSPNTPDVHDLFKRF